jgi:hypothetical protein
LFLRVLQMQGGRDSYVGARDLWNDCGCVIGARSARRASGLPCVQVVFFYQVRERTNERSIALVFAHGTLGAHGEPLIDAVAVEAVETRKDAQGSLEFF